MKLALSTDLLGCDSLTTGAQLEESKDLVTSQAQVLWPIRGREQRFEQLTLFFENGMDPFFDRSFAGHAGDGHAAGGTNSMGSIDGLIFDGGIPPSIEQKHVPAKLQIQSNAAGTVTHQQDMFCGIFLELFQNRVTLFGRNSSMIF
mgnify:CR=1 FL=1